MDFFVAAAQLGTEEFSVCDLGTNFTLWKEFLTMAALVICFSFDIWLSV